MIETRFIMIWWQQAINVKYACIVKIISIIRTIDVKSFPDKERFLTGSYLKMECLYQKLTIIIHYGKVKEKLPSARNERKNNKQELF